MPARSGVHSLYRPRGPDPLRKLFRLRFPASQAIYEQRYAAFFGKFRLPLILRAASAFRLCGDWSQGIDRIRCPDCGYDLLRPFSCKKVLRVFLRHDRDLFADIGRLPFDILSRFFTQAAGVGTLTGTPSCWRAGSTFMTDSSSFPWAPARL